MSKCHAAVCSWLIACAAALALARDVRADALRRNQGEEVRPPNILWITCEDISPNLGCYGDPYAVTPNLDRLARQAVRYTSAFAPIGVCAPARSCLITGMYPPSIGTHHMRCTGTLPNFVRCFPEYLRQAGYYCSNNVKTDYNFPPPPSAWDESSRNAHWRNRAAGQPFFSVFNFTSCHESQIRLPEDEYQKRTAHFTPQQRHDPAKALVPPYHPDAPEVRRDWARYADMITYMDGQVGDLLAQLVEDGLADETIVFFYSDHGAGMPRSKRWLYDSSLRVPLLIRFPEKYRNLAPGGPGSTTERLVSFVDFGPTVLSLAGVPIPRHMQGRAFLGDQQAEPRRYIFGFRDRMDERYDMLRCVRDPRYKYIRNFMPHLPYFGHQYLSYMYQMPTMQVWQRLADEGKLSGPPALFMAESKPTEELYDTEADPYEINNLADSPDHQAVLQRLRGALRDWMAGNLDLGLLPEPDLRTRFGDEPQYVAVRRDPDAYPFERIFAAATLAGARNAQAVPRLQAMLADSDPAVRYWGAVGLGARGDSAAAAADALEAALDDPAGAVRVAAADALCRQGRYDAAVPALAKALADDNPWTRLMAANVLDRIDAHARPALAAIQTAQHDENSYVVRVVTHALDDL
jgi:arylsulfatase A-like enzyme